MSNGVLDFKGNDRYTMWAGVAVAGNKKSQHSLFNKRKDSHAQISEDLHAKHYLPKQEEMNKGFATTTAGTVNSSFAKLGR